MFSAFLKKLTGLEGSRFIFTNGAISSEKGGITFKAPWGQEGIITTNGKSLKLVWPYNLAKAKFSPDYPIVESYNSNNLFSFSTLGYDKEFKNFEEFDNAKGFAEAFEVMDVEKIKTLISSTEDKSIITTNGIIGTNGQLEQNKHGIIFTNGYGDDVLFENGGPNNKGIIFTNGATGDFTIIFTNGIIFTNAQLHNGSNGVKDIKDFGGEAIIFTNGAIDAQMGGMTFFKKAENKNYFIDLKGGMKPLS